MFRYEVVYRVYFRPWVKERTYTRRKYRHKVVAQDMAAALTRTYEHINAIFPGEAYIVLGVWRRDRDFRRIYHLNLTDDEEKEMMYRRVETLLI